MASPYTKVGLLAVTNPDKARAQILAALKQAQMHRRKAATALGLDISTLRRLISKLGLDAQVDALDESSKDNGWRHQSKGGWPLGRRRKEPEPPPTPPAKKAARPRRRAA